MAETIAERVRRYALDGSDADLQRLLRISELSADRVRSALAGAGAQPGWRVLDCGCGPLGALPVMAEVVGPAGRVVGVDFSAPTVERARSVASTLGLDNVELHVGDVHDLDTDSLGGPFDLAYTRCFLMHQRDPSRTLARIASLLRPGGWIVVHEPLRSPAPRSSPPLDSLDRYWELMHDVAERLGVPHRSIDDLPRSASEAGLEVVDTDGYFDVIDPERGFAVHAGTIAATRERAVEAGIATAEEVDALVAELRTACDGGYEWVSTPFFLVLTMRARGA